MKMKMVEMADAAARVTALEAKKEKLATALTKAEAENKEVFLAIGGL